MNGRPGSGSDTGSFPEVAWGRRGTSASRAAQRVAGTAVGSWLIRTLVPVDRWMLGRSGGRYTVLGPFGAPLLLLTTTGCRSGQPRTTPLVYVLEGDRLLLAASNFGQARHPAWSANLLAHPEATVVVGRRTFAVPPRCSTAPRPGGAWAALRGRWPARTGSTGQRTDREIRVFASTPAQRRAGLRPAGL